MHPIARVLSLALVVAATAWGPASQAKDLAIGALFPMSGPNATYGDIFGSGTNLAADHINADKMLDGTLTVKYEDSQALPQQGVIGMNKLVNVEGVPYVLSAFTGVSKAISTAATRTKTVAVNGGGVGPDLAELGPYFWNVIPLANDEVRAMLPYLVKERNLKRFVLVYVDDPFGSALLKDLQKALPKAGGELAESLSIPTTAQQFGGIAARVRSANPDVVFIASYGAQQAQIVKQFRDNGVTQQMVSYSAFSIPQMMSLPEAKGILFTTQSVDWKSPDPVTQRFVKDYEAKYQKAPTAYIANYYNATRLFALLAHALQKDGKPVTGENLLAQRNAMRTFDMVGGKLTFQDNGTVISPMQINEIVGGTEGSKIVTVVTEAR